MALLVGLAAWLGRKRPALLELMMDFLHDVLSDVMGRPAVRYLPFLGTLAIFITAANTFSVVPYITAPTRDISTPLALALLVFLSVHFYGIREKGLWRYLKDMATPVYALPLEIIGQFSRTLALTLRLFGNIVSGEMVVAVLFALAPLLVPIPMAGFSLFTGVLQAYIFTSLASVYIAAGIEATEPTSVRKPNRTRS